MKKHRALWVIIIVIVVLAAAAAGVWFWLQSRLDETQQAHQAVYAKYQAMTARYMKMHTLSMEQVRGTNGKISFVDVLQQEKAL